MHTLAALVNEPDLLPPPPSHTRAQNAISAGNWEEALNVYATGKNSISGASFRTYYVSAMHAWDVLPLGSTHVMGRELL